MRLHIPIACAVFREESIQEYLRDVLPSQKLASSVRNEALNGEMQPPTR